VAAKRGIGQRLQQAEAVAEAMWDEQAHPGAAVGERERRKVPYGSVLAIQWGLDLLALAGPGAGRYRMGDALHVSVN
jgi:hypothetical protein